MLFCRIQYTTVSLIVKRLTVPRMLENTIVYKPHMRIHSLSHSLARLLTHIGSTKARLLKIRQLGHLVLHLQERV